MGYGVSLVDSNSDLYFASVNAVMYAMSCYTGPRYNGTQLQLNIKSVHNVTSMNMDTYINHINLLATNQMTITKQLKTGPGVGVTKPIFSVPLFSTFSVIVKTNVSYWISRSYLAGVAAAQLRWHLSNMNVIQGI